MTRNLPALICLAILFEIVYCGIECFLELIEVFEVQENTLSLPGAFGTVGWHLGNYDVRFTLAVLVGVDVVYAGSTADTL